MATNDTNKLWTAVDVLSENLFEYSIVEALKQIIESPHFDDDDVEHFIRYAIDCNDRGEIPTFKEWFAIIAPEKTGAPSPKR